MDDRSKKSVSKEDLDKQEAERLRKLEEARKELAKPDTEEQSEDRIDEQESDGSANAFEKK